MLFKKRGRSGVSQKGQITLFAIIGIIVLAGALLFFFLQNNSSENGIDLFTNDVTTAEVHFRPVQDYVEGCLSITGRQALDLIGAHGGYIDPFSSEYMIPLSYQKGIVGNNDGLMLTDNDDSFVPYWVHSISDVKTDALQMELTFPSEELIIRQVEDYVNRNINVCLDNLTALDKTGIQVLEQGDISTTVQITDDEVIFKLNMPLNVEKDGDHQLFEAYLTREPIPLRELLLRAKQITLEEYNNQYLENLIMHLVGFYDNLDSSYLPPLSQHNLDQTSVVWTQFQINQNLKSFLNSYMPLFRFAGTLNARLFSKKDLLSDQEINFYNSFLLPTFSSISPKLEINHLFLDWDIYSKVTSSTSNGEVLTITPSSTSGFPLRAPDYDSSYNFYYDVTYPVIVDLTQKGLSDGSDYSFLFAMEANVRNNRNAQEYLQGKGPIDWDPNQVSVTIPGAEDELKDSISADGTKLAALPTKLLFFKENQLLSGNMTLGVQDKYSGKPLADVDIFAGIGDYASTLIGKTNYDVYGDATINSKLPLFTNGFISLKKDGYYDKFIPVSTSMDENLNLGFVGMDKKQTKNINLKVLETFLTPTNTNLIERNLTSDEEVFLFISRIPDEYDFSPFSQVIVANYTTSFQEVDFVPGRYTIYATLIDNAGVVIPENSKHICSGVECWFLSDEEEYIPDEPVVLKPANWGGIDYDDSFPWFLSSNDLYNESSNITFKVLKFAQPKNLDALEDLGMLNNYSMKYRSRLMPEIN